MVGAQCSGLRSIVTLLTLVALVVFMVQGPWWSKALLALSSVPIAILGNMLRVSSLLGVANIWGADVGFKYYHDYSGIVFFLSALLLLVAVQPGGRMSRDQRRLLLVIVAAGGRGGRDLLIGQRERLGAAEQRI